ncbi:MAG: prephenate dehydrogenase dimerization domain-containing protein [Pyrinomonadaceae bacterium]
MAGDQLCGGTSVVQMEIALGARPELLDAAVHDHRVAFTSHLPHAASAAIALTLSRADVSMRDLGPGERDVLRIAASSPEMWTDIAMDNSEPMMHALSAMVTQLDRFHSALAARDARALHELFSTARNWASEIIPDGATMKTERSTATWRRNMGMRPCKIEH